MFPHLFTCTGAGLPTQGGAHLEEGLLGWVVLPKRVALPRVVRTQGRGLDVGVGHLADQACTAPPPGVLPKRVIAQFLQQESPNLYCSKLRLLPTQTLQLMESRVHVTGSLPTTREIQTKVPLGRLCEGPLNRTVLHGTPTSRVERSDGTYGFQLNFHSFSST